MTEGVLQELKPADFTLYLFVDNQSRILQRCLNNKGYPETMILGEEVIPAEVLFAENGQLLQVDHRKSGSYFDFRHSVTNAYFAASTSYDCGFEMVRFMKNGRPVNKAVGQVPQQKWKSKPPDVSEFIRHLASRRIVSAVQSDKTPVGEAGLILLQRSIAACIAAGMPPMPTLWRGKPVALKKKRGKNWSSDIRDMSIGSYKGLATVAELPLEGLTIAQIRGAAIVSAMKITPMIARSPQP